MVGVSVKQLVERIDTDTLHFLYPRQVLRSSHYTEMCIEVLPYCATNWNLPKCYAKSIDKVFTNISDGWYVNKYNFSVKLPQKMPVCIIA